MSGAAKRRRYSREPDLEVVVEGRTFTVSSYVLMSASDVFATMLESGMCESEEGRIVLCGKSKDDYRTLMCHIDLHGGAAPPNITDDSIQVLLSWSDEYQIHGLKKRCEEFLLSKEDCTPRKVQERMELADRFNLHQLRDKCVRFIGQSIHSHRDVLRDYIHDASVMKKLLPKMFQAAGLESKELPTSGELSIEQVWPLVIRALEAMHGWKCLAENQEYRHRAQFVAKLVRDVLPEYYDVDAIPADAKTLDQIEKAMLAQRKDLDTAELRNLLTRLPGIDGVNGKYWLDGLLTDIARWNSHRDS